MLSRRPPAYGTIPTRTSRSAILHFIYSPKSLPRNFLIFDFLNMPRLHYRIENAPGKLYGKNANELVFKEPSSGAVVYSTTTVSGVMKSTQKQLFRGPASEKAGGVCVATIDEPSSGTLEMHHHHPVPSSPTSSTLKMNKTSSWVPFSGKNNHAVTFRDAKYTWHGTTQLKRDRDGHVVAELANPWFWQGKLGDLEVDVTSSSAGEGGGGGGGAAVVVDEEDRDVLEMVLATFVLRWWGEKVRAEQEAADKKRHQEERKRDEELERKAVASQEREQQEQRKREEEAIKEGKL